MIEYETASPEVRAVFDDIMATRKVDSVNNFWKALAADPATLRRTWESLKEVMAPGALDPLVKEMIESAGRHHFLQALPGTTQSGRVRGQRLPEIVHGLHFPRRHDVVEHRADFGARRFVFNHSIRSFQSRYLPQTPVHRPGPPAKQRG